MNKPRFHLEKYHRARRYTCPACGRPHCYARYVDSLGQILLPMECGRCDHEVSCGYHRPPREFLSDTFPDPLQAPAGLLLPMKELKSTSKPQALEESDRKKTISMPEVIVKHSMRRYGMNPLYLFLSKVFGPLSTLTLFKRYGVGTSKRWGGATVFWQRDTDGIVRTGKIMGYNPDDGHRVKEPRPLMQWAHCLVPREITTEDHSQAQPPYDFQLSQCYFGEHLLRNYPLTTTVYIVESEKTALIASGFCPDGLWIATGGISNLRSSKALKDRPVVLFPDLGAESKWMQKAQEMMEGEDRPASVTVSRLLTNHASEEQRQKGWDLADFLLAGLINKPYLLCHPDHPDYNPFPSSSLSLSSFPPLTENETPKTNNAMEKNTPQSPDVEPNINDNSPLTAHHSPLLSEVVENAREGQFPIEAFPSDLRKLVMETSQQADFQQEYTAMSMLSALASALGNGAEVTIRNQWKVNPALMMVLVGRPGSGKTPPLLAAYQPLKDLDVRRYEQWRKDRDAYEWQERQKAYQEGQEPLKRPKLKQTVLSDFTQEALTSQLEANDRGVAIVVDEIAGFFNTVNRYNASNLIESLMSAFSGESIKVNRKGLDGKGEMVVVSRPSINLVGTIQPSLVGSVLIRPYLGNGFLDRVCVVFPQPRKTVMWVNDRGQSKSDSQSTALRWTEVLQQAVNIPHAQGGCWRPDFSDDALDFLYQWRNDLMTLNDDLDEDEVESRSMKRLAITAKLALILQASQVASGAKSHGDPISVATVAAAVALNEWLEWSYSRMIRVSQEMQGKYTGPSQKQIDAWAFVADLPAEFTTSQAVQAAEDKMGKKRAWAFLKLNEMVQAQAIRKVNHGRFRKANT